MENSISIRYPDNYSNPISTIRKISCEQVLSNFQIYLDCVQTLSCWGYELTPCGTGCARNLVDLIFIKSYFKTIKNSFFIITCFVRRQVLLNDQNGRQIDGQTSVFGQCITWRVQRFSSAWTMNRLPSSALAVDRLASTWPQLLLNRFIQIFASLNI